MKKILALTAATLLAFSAFAADVMTYVPVSGSVKSYVKTEYSIASKFGNYFRTPSAKITHILDEKGNEIESSELTPKDVLLNKISSTYDDNGNLIEQACTDIDDNLIWKNVITYKNGQKVDLSEYDSMNNLRAKTIYAYTEGKLVDESCYNSDGGLVMKLIYKYNAQSKLESLANYDSEGRLVAFESYTYNESGILDTLLSYDSFENQQTQEVFRYDADSGVLNEITTYDNNKQVTKRVIIKYDTFGNVAKVSEYTVAQKFGTIVNELAAMCEYTYEYGKSAPAAAKSADGEDVIEIEE